MRLSFAPADFISLDLAFISMAKGNRVFWMNMMVRARYILKPAVQRLIAHAGIAGRLIIGQESNAAKHIPGRIVSASHSHRVRTVPNMDTRIARVLASSTA